jgi:hypothetical protein
MRGSGLIEGESIRAAAGPGRACAPSSERRCFFFSTQDRLSPEQARSPLRCRGYRDQPSLPFRPASLLFILTALIPVRIEAVVGVSDSAPTDTTSKPARAVEGQDTLQELPLRCGRRLLQAGRQAACCCCLWGGKERGLAPLDPRHDLAGIPACAFPCDQPNTSHPQQAAHLDRPWRRGWDKPRPGAGAARKAIGGGSSSPQDQRHGPGARRRSRAGHLIQSVAALGRLVVRLLRGPVVARTAARWWIDWDDRSSIESIDRSIDRTRPRAAAAAAMIQLHGHISLTPSHGHR